MEEETKMAHLPQQSRRPENQPAPKIPLERLFPQLFENCVRDDFLAAVTSRRMNQHRPSGPFQTSVEIVGQTTFVPARTNNAQPLLPRPSQPSRSQPSSHQGQMAENSGQTVNIRLLSELLQFIREKQAQLAAHKSTSEDSLLRRVEREIERRQGENLEHRELRSSSQFELLYQILYLEGVIRQLTTQSPERSEDQEIKDERSQEQVKSRRLQQARDQLKVTYAQVELAQYLKTVDGASSIAIAAKVRNILRHNGEPFKGSQYRGVCRNASRFQVGLANRTDLHYGEREKQTLHRRIHMSNRSSESVRPSGDPAQRNEGKKRVTQAHTNFNYTKEEVVAIMRGEPVFAVYDQEKTAHLF